MKRLLCSLLLISAYAVNAQEAADKKEAEVKKVQEAAANPINSVEWQKGMFKELVEQVSRSTGLIAVLRHHGPAKRQLMDEAVQELYHAIEVCDAGEGKHRRDACSFLRRYLKKYEERVCKDFGFVSKVRTNETQELCEELPFLEAAYNAKNFWDTSLDD